MKQAQYIQKLEDALQNLLDEQNGTPLKTREIEYNLAYWNALDVLKKGIHLEPIKNRVIRLDFVGPDATNSNFTVIDQWIMEDGDTQFNYERRLNLKGGNRDECDSIIIHWGDESILAAVEIAMAKEEEARQTYNDDVNIQLLLEEISGSQGIYTFDEESEAADLLDGIFLSDDEAWE